MESLILHGNNEMSIALTKNMESQHYIKHIDVQHHYIRELISEGEFIVKWILGLEVLADKITKGLFTKIFKKH